MSKITKKNNHVPYNMRCWKCCPPSSKHCWHLFGICEYTRINSISEMHSILRLTFALNSSNVRICDFYLWGHLKNKVYATNPHTLEELKESIRCEIDCISGNSINSCKCTFPKKDARNVWMKEDNNSNISCYKVRDYFSLLFQ